jgi:hypothetical protein
MAQRMKQQTKRKTLNGRVRDEVAKSIAEAKATFASTTSLIISALTLVAGLAWNDVMKTIFVKLKPLLSGWGETIGLLLYAVTVTLIAVIIVRRLQKIKQVVGGRSIKKAPSKLTGKKKK